MDVEIHLPKEGQIISKNSKSQAKLLHGIQVVIARNYVENLKEEVKKGMREKAEQGIYPSRPPLGYLNNKLDHTIAVDPAKAPIAKRMFELYASGRFSVMSLRARLKQEFGVVLAKGYLERLLKNPFYVGDSTGKIVCIEEPTPLSSVSNASNRCAGSSGPQQAALQLT